MKDEKDKEVLTDWFKCDENMVPPTYILQPIREKLEHYVNEEEPDKKKEVSVVLVKNTTNLNIGIKCYFSLVFR